MMHMKKTILLLTALVICAISDAEEIARYDLSGRPCSPTAKGVQVIVYSDYTTRTIIAD